jgi:hypothetical protein
MFYCSTIFILCHDFPIYENNIAFYRHLLLQRFNQILRDATKTEATCGESGVAARVPTFVGCMVDVDLYLKIGENPREKRPKMATKWLNSYKQ